MQIFNYLNFTPSAAFCIITHFCDKPNLTPSNKKFVFLLIEGGRGWDKWDRFA